MSLRARIIVAAACAVLAVALMAGYAASVRSQASAQRAGALERYGGETAQVCVTTRAVARGETFTERNVSTMEWLVDLLPEGALADPSQLMGKTAASALAANTPVSGVDVDTQADPLDVPAGKTAISVPCSAESAVGGALTPGALVDMYLVSDGTARLLSASVQVLQTSAGSSGAGLSWVTVAVDPARVEAIIAASSLQRLYFAIPSDEPAQRAPTQDGLDGAQAQPQGTAGQEAPGGEADMQADGGSTAVAQGEAGQAADGQPAGEQAAEGQPAEERAADGQAAEDQGQTTDEQQPGEDGA